ncbi:MAG: hypothetical protein FJ244_02060 [Nitrospira sp.]|nr:hypothetical protein [Nitrospira sp.]
MHKLTNVLDALPKKAQATAVERLKAMPYAETQTECERQRDAFLHQYRKTDPKAVDTLLRNWDHMVTFRAFPKEHWIHIRTMNIVESLVATSMWRAPRRSSGKSSGWPSRHGANSMCQCCCHSLPPVCCAKMGG